MKVGILAGGFGSRLAEETDVRPKPMVEIGGIPLLVHIMNIYAAHGFGEFVVALGYKGESIKRYFADSCQLGGTSRSTSRTAPCTAKTRRVRPGAST
jgi:glucose-1-phosphate cytidylyltransferase